MPGGLNEENRIWNLLSMYGSQTVFIKESFIGSQLEANLISGPRSQKKELKMSAFRFQGEILVIFKKLSKVL